VASKIKTVALSFSRLHGAAAIFDAIHEVHFGTVARRKMRASGEHGA
jgi:hypothetical protein